MAKTTSSGKSHGMRAVCNLVEWKFESEAGDSAAERKLPSSII